MKSIRFSKHSPSIRGQALFLIILSIVLICLGESSKSVHVLRTTLSYLVTPIRFSVDGAVKGLVWLEEGTLNRHGLQAKNAQLLKERALLQSQLQSLEQLKTENTRLRDLLALEPSQSIHYQAAELIATSQQPYQQQIQINKGKLAGIHTNQAVLDNLGVMGQVIMVEPLQSTVLLITDSRSAVPVENARNGLRAIAQGVGQSDTLSLLHVPKNADFKAGDELFTSGLGGVYAKGYALGIVDKGVVSPGEAFAQVWVKPKAAIDRSRFVLLLEGEPV